MKLKSIAGLFAALVFAFAVVACDDGDDATEAPAEVAGSRFARPRPSSEAGRRTPATSITQKRSRPVPRPFPIPGSEALLRGVSWCVQSTRLSPASAL